MKIRRSVFDSPMQDEVELAKQTKQHLVTLSNPPTKDEILHIAKAYSTDLATRCFFEGIRQSIHSKTIDAIESQPVDPTETKHKLLLYIIPGMFYKEHPELGTNGALVKKIAQKFDIDVKLIDTHSKGSISENSEKLIKQLQEETHPNIWLLSISKGSCDVRSALQSTTTLKNINGWIDISGVHQGIPFIDQAFNTIITKAYLRLISSIFRIKYTVFKELRTSEQRWKNKTWPKDMKIIHIVPVPIQSHINHSILRRYKQTLTHGPNDGFVPLVDVLEMPGSIYPIWGYDHFLRTSDLSIHLHKLFNYIINKKTTNIHSSL